MTQLISFHGDLAIKAKYLARLKAHHAADELVKGVYWEDGKGCAVGCTLHSAEHRAYETELGLPEWYARLVDSIFEKLPNGDARQFAVDSIGRVPVSLDFSGVRKRFFVALMDYNLAIVDGLSMDDALKAQVIDAIKLTRGFHAASAEAESAAESSARAVAESAAESSAWSAGSAAWSAAESAWSAGSAAWSAAWSAWSARSAAESAVAWAAWSAAESAVAAAETASAWQKIAGMLFAAMQP